MPAHIRAILSEIEPEILERYYGCGLVAPDCLDGARILDLGCGAGRDAYLLARLAGPDGSVTGIDATPAQLDIARRHLSTQCARFGFSKPNARFIEGEIEKLSALGLEPGSFDVIGDFSRHYGIFPGCGTQMPFDAGAAPASGGCC